MTIVAVVIGYQILSIISTRSTAPDHMENILQKVSIDAEIQYNMVVRSGTSIDRCVHAGMVAAAHLQANDEEKYKRWKAIEKQDCIVANVPR